MFRVISTIFSMCLLCSCAPTVVTPPKTQLEIREFQTRTYENKDTKMVMKALLNALQDEAFIIKNADRELGFISASKEVDVENGSDRFFSVLLGGSQARYRKQSIVESSLNVTEFGNLTKVRATFQIKTLDNFGSPLGSTMVEDPQYYQNFFSKVDKSIFFEKEKL